mgnify:CR=1 FL=1
MGKLMIEQDELYSKTLLVRQPSVTVKGGLGVVLKVKKIRRNTIQMSMKEV